MCAKSRYKDKVYETPLVVISHRDEKGVARNRTIVNLSKLPKFIVKLVQEGLKRGGRQGVGGVGAPRRDHLRRHGGGGPAFVVLTVLKQLGIYDAVMASLPPRQAVATLNIVTERVIAAAKPLSVRAQQRRFERDPLAFLPGQEAAPSWKTW